MISELLGDNDDSVEPVLCTNSPGELCDLRRDNDLDTDFKGKLKVRELAERELGKVCCRVLL